MDILLYLTELLQSRKAIGIVGLGTLYKKKSPGKYDIEKHAFVPPSYALEFTTELKEQEELANFISESRNISIDSANYYISEFVEKLQAQLADQQEADLTPIGRLKIVDDQLTFIAEQESSFSNESYGLPTLNELTTENSEETDPTNEIIASDETIGLETSVDEEKVAASDEVEDTIDSVVEENKLEEENPGQETGETLQENELDEQPVYDEIAEIGQPVEEPLTEAEPSAATEENKEIPVAPSTIPPVVNYNYLPDNDEDDDDDRRPNRFFRILLKTLIVLILIAIAGALAYFFFPGWFDNKLVDTIDKTTEHAVVVSPNDTAGVKTDSLKYADSIAKNNALIKLTKDSTIIDSNKTIIYEVIGSAEKSQKRIDYVVNTMKKRGINAKPLQNVPGRLTKISLGTFTDYKLAKIYQDSLQKKLKNPQIYIQSIKPKN
jgi:hypothetical protein